MTKTNTMVKCPECQKSHAYDTSNAFRPFCSERCKLIDFNSWASDGYAIPAQESMLNQTQAEYDED
ncbi:DNA gyrase inhibitor YacG [Marinicellulosiphila megalodicopiae]|uniref:DNA gyrase inhibitor YacG n=1 Tax=Marinicellulosiphila megalodicopiae TaxID=2724896 RepID=UPI003BAFC5B3